MFVLWGRSYIMWRFFVSFLNIEYINTLLQSHLLDSLYLLDWITWSDLITWSDSIHSVLLTRFREFRLLKKLKIASFVLDRVIKHLKFFNWSVSLYIPTTIRISQHLTKLTELPKSCRWNRTMWSSYYTYFVILHSSTFVA